MPPIVECPSCGYRGVVSDEQKTWTCQCRRRWRVANTIASGDAPSRAGAGPTSVQPIQQRTPWGFSQFLWAGVLTQIVAGLVFIATVASTSDNVDGGASAAGIIVSVILGWVGGIWLLVGIGGWAVQVGTLNLRSDVQQLRHELTRVDT